MSFGHAVFLLRIVCTIHLVIKYLSKIIYHNITPSAVYDAVTVRKIARKILQVYLRRQPAGLLS